MARMYTKVYGVWPWTRPLANPIPERTCIAVSLSKKHRAHWVSFRTRRTLRRHISSGVLRRRRRLLLMTALATHLVGAADQIVTPATRALDRRSLQADSLQAFSIAAAAVAACP